MLPVACGVLTDGTLPSEKRTQTEFSEGAAARGGGRSMDEQGERTTSCSDQDMLICARVSGENKDISPGGNKIVKKRLFR